MAIGFLAALQMLPWSDIVSSAPTVVDGAKKLWESVSRKKIPVEVQITDSKIELTAEARAMQEVNGRISNLELEVFELKNEMISSSELINALANQNSLLIQNVDFLKKKIRTSIILSGIFFTIITASIFYVIFFR